MISSVSNVGHVFISPVIFVRASLFEIALLCFPVSVARRHQTSEPYRSFLISYRLIVLYSQKTSRYTGLSNIFSPNRRLRAHRTLVALCCEFSIARFH